MSACEARDEIIREHGRIVLFATAIADSIYTYVADLTRGGYVTIGHATIWTDTLYGHVYEVSKVNLVNESFSCEMDFSLGMMKNFVISSIVFSLNKLNGSA